MILHAKGLNACEIRDVLLSCESVVVSEEMVEGMLEWVMPGFTAWQSRPLAPVYERVCLIELTVVIKQDRKQTNKRAIALLGIIPEGYGEVLGLWLTATPNELFWEALLSGLRFRGLQKILTITGFESKALVLAVDNVFPETEIRHSERHYQNGHSRLVKSKDGQRIYQGTWAAGDTQDPSDNAAHGLYMRLYKAIRPDAPFSGDEAVIKALFWRAMGWKASVTSFSSGRETPDSKG